jgi:hypothetical protein
LLDRSRRYAGFSRVAAALEAMKARILLKADQAKAGGGWADEEICRALDTNTHGGPGA